MEKMKLSDRFITAMFLPKEYDRLLKLKIHRIISYIIILILLVSFIEFAIPNLGAIAGMGGVKNIILNEIPDFSLKDGTFSYDDKVEWKDETMQMYVLVDTEKEKFSKEDLPEGMSQVVMVSKSNMLTLNDVGGLGAVMETQFSDFKDFALDNKSAAKFAPIVYLLFAFTFAIYYMFTLIKYLFIALIYSGIVFFFIRVVWPQVTYGMVYKIALFAQTIGLIVEAVTTVLGTELFLFAGMIFNMFVTVLLMNKALVYLKMKEQNVNLQ